MSNKTIESATRYFETAISLVRDVVGIVKSHVPGKDRDARRKAEIDILSRILFCSPDMALKLKMGFVSHLGIVTLNLLKNFLQIIEVLGFEEAVIMSEQTARQWRKNHIVSYTPPHFRNICFAIAYTYNLSLKEAAYFAGSLFKIKKTTAYFWLINNTKHPRIAYVWGPAFIDGCMKYGVKRSCRMILDRGVMVSIAPGPSSSSVTTTAKKVNKPASKKEDDKESDKRSPRLARARKQQRSDERTGRKPPVKRPTLQDRLKGNVPRSAAQRRKARTRFRPTLEDRLEMARASKPGN